MIRMKRFLVLLSLIDSSALAGGFVDSINAGYVGLQKRSSAPGNPSTDWVNCYVLNSDGKLYCKNSAGTASVFLRSGDVANADLTGSAAITNANLANMANSTIKCRKTSGTGAPEDCSSSDVVTILGAAVNPMTTAGDTIYGGTSGAQTRLAGNTTTTKKFYTSTGTGSAATAPALATIANADLPFPGSSALGGIFSNACLSHQFFNSLNTDGSSSCAQPAFSDLSGTATSGQMPAHVVFDNSAPSFTVPIVNSYSPTASTPVMKFTGGIYASGTATTAKAAVLIEDASSSNAWNTHGTYLGVNANSFFVGNLLDLQLNASSVFSVDYTGKVIGVGSGLTALNASNISTGTIGAARLPNPSSTTLGGVESLASTSHQWINTISTSGVPSSTQPAFSDLSGSVAAAQIPNPSSTTLGGIESITSASHNWVAYIDTSGVPHQSQPAFSDISGTPTVAQLVITNSALTTCTTARTVDWSTGSQFTLLLTNANTCAITFSNPTSGQVITIDYSQPASTGSAVVSYSSTVLWAGGTVPTMTTGGSKTDTCTFKYNGTDYRGSCVQDMR